MTSVVEVPVACTTVGPPALARAVVTASWLMTLVVEVPVVWTRSTLIVLFAILIFNYFAFKNQLVLYYALLNLIVGVFNSLPVLGLDGGTILYSVLAKRGDNARAELTVKLITIATAAVIMVAAIYFTIKGRFNLSFYIISIYLFILSLIK
jgi:Zn-dependent protease